MDGCTNADDDDDDDYDYHEHVHGKTTLAAMRITTST